LDEYSDPYDLKKEIEQTVSSAEVVGTASEPAEASSVAAVADIDLPAAPEDDYSVPYELKKRIQGKLKFCINIFLLQYSD
jgi:hypothetical protein